MRKPSWKTIFILAIFAVLFLGSAFAEGIEEADIYYVNVKIIKIFPHSKGYYVVYKRSKLQTGEAFIPYEWFTAADGRAKLCSVNNRVAPYISFFIRDGKFEKVKVAAPMDKGSSIWGSLRTPKDYDEKFEGVEALELKF